MVACCIYLLLQLASSELFETLWRSEARAAWWFRSSIAVDVDDRPGPQPSSSFPN